MSTPNLSSIAGTSATQRLVSLDALRGFDMFWILGADSLVQGLREVSSSGPVQRLADQLEHVEWEGFHFYDLIFPLFVFLVGVSAVYSLVRIQQREGTARAYRRLVTRSVILYLLGLFYYGGLSRDGGPEMFRFVGVLQRIATCYLAAGLIVLNFRWRGVALICTGLLVGYWLLMTFVPVPQYGAGVLEPGRNLAHFVDSVALPGYKWDGDWDPEGLLSTLPAIGSALLGVLAGMTLRYEGWTPARKLALFVVLGLGCLAAGWLWSFQFPIIKKLWTSSYVLVAGGWSYLLLALFYGIIDIAGYQLWARPFVWIGTNCITIYLLANLLNFPSMVRRVLHDGTLQALGNFAPLLVSILSLGLALLICQQLYQRRVFIRV
jgi:predicted acyltransferase